MGDIADAMLSGLFCQTCGEIIDDDEPGYPRSCGGCGGEVAVGSGKRRRRRAREARRMQSRMLNRKAAAEDNWVREHFRQCDERGVHLQARFGTTIINFWPGTMKYAVGPDRGHRVSLPDLKAVVEKAKQEFIDQQVKEVCGGAV